MKKLLVALSMILALSACEKRVPPVNEKLVEAPKVEDNKEEIKNITNQFEYLAHSGRPVSVTEIINDFGETCVIAHANYMYDSSEADISCIPRRNEKIFSRDKNEIVKQFSYSVKNVPVQVTMIRTIRNNNCTIVHANYMFDSSTAKISCN